MFEENYECDCDLCSVEEDNEYEDEELVEFVLNLKSALKVFVAETSLEASKYISEDVDELYKALMSDINTLQGDLNTILA